jgi:hypothetical protein
LGFFDFLEQKFGLISLKNKSILTKIFDGIWVELLLKKGFYIEKTVILYFIQLSNLQLMQEQTDEQLKRMMEQLERMIVNDGNGQGQKRIHPQQKMHQMQFHPQYQQQLFAFAFQPPKLTATMITDEKENGERDQNGNGEEEEKKSIEKV